MFHLKYENLVCSKLCKTTCISVEPKLILLCTSQRKLKHLCKTFLSNSYKNRAILLLLLNRLVYLNLASLIAYWTRIRKARGRRKEARKLKIRWSKNFTPFNNSPSAMDIWCFHRKRRWLWGKLYFHRVPGDFFNGFSNFQVPSAYYQRSWPSSNRECRNMLIFKR